MNRRATQQPKIVLHAGMLPAPIPEWKPRIDHLHSYNVATCTLLKIMRFFNSVELPTNAVISH